MTALCSVQPTSSRTTLLAALPTSAMTTREQHWLFEQQHLHQTPCMVLAFMQVADTGHLVSCQ